MESVQALRGIAALFVICQHICFLQRGSFGVDLFFLISGFVVMLSTERSTEHFMGKRAVRILPLYWSLTVIIWGGVLMFPDLFENSEGTFMNLYKSLSFIPFSQDGAMQPVVRVGWTINYEVQFYLLFMLSMQISWRFRALICSGMLAVLTVIGVLFPKLPVPLAFWTDSIILEFAFGMGLFYVVHAMFGLLCRKKGNAQAPQSALQNEPQDAATQNIALPVETMHVEASENRAQDTIHAETSEDVTRETVHPEMSGNAVQETVRTEMSEDVTQEAVRSGLSSDLTQAGARNKSKNFLRYLGWYTALAVVSAAVFYYEWKSYEFPAVCRLPEIIRWGLPSVLLFLLFAAAGTHVHMPRLLIKIGNISFSLYLLHYYPMQFLNRMIHHTTTPDTREVLITLAVVAAVIFVSWISYLLIEKLLGNYLRRELLCYFEPDKTDPDIWPMITL